MQFKTWQEFFDAEGKHQPHYAISGKEFSGTAWSFTIEEMYQHITARWEEEAFDRIYKRIKARLMDGVVAELATKEIYRDGNRYDMRVDNRELPLKNKGE